MKRFFLATLLFGILVGRVSGAEGVSGGVPEPYEEAIAAMRAVGREGEGNEAAAEAWRQVVQSDVGMVVPLLEAMDGANGLASNWLVSAAQAIADREMEAGRSLPVAELGTFLMDTQEDPQARRLAFELIERVDADIAGALVPGMLNDPSNALRRDAVAGLLSRARTMREAGKEPGAVVVYRQALGAARDIDQIDEAAKALRELGQEVDLPRHFGFLMRWSVAGPFDNSDREGFDAVYPPEEGVDLEAEMEGKTGPVKWTSLDSSDAYGVIDINQAYGPLKEVAAYAYTEYVSETAGPAELRLGCKNAWKIWLNGELVFGRDEYHRGMRIDQYKMPVTLREGKNAVLVKVCQNEQEEDWTVEWQFQLRVCDAAGTALLSEDRQATPSKPSRRGGVDRS